MCTGLFNAECRLVIINRSVHEKPGEDRVFGCRYGFLQNPKHPIGAHFEIIEKVVEVNSSIWDTSRVGISKQVIEPVHVERAVHQFV